MAIKFKLKLRSPIQFASSNDANLPAVNPGRGISRPRVLEIGAPGQMISGGFLAQLDYNADLQAPYVYDTYDRMRKSDGQVAALMNAVKLPILNVDWHMSPGSDDAADVAIAKWAWDALNNMTSSFDNLLYNVLLYLDYGSMPFEKVWDLDADNNIVPRKIAPRHPRTIAFWNVDDNGGLSGITQNVFKAASFSQTLIPVDKILVFVNNQEGADWRGTSLLRPAYKHWFYKDKFMIIDAIAKERRGVGVDVGTMKGTDIDSQDEADLEYALMGLHAHEKQFMIEQEERFTYRVEGLQGRPLTILDSVEYHDKMILRSMLAEFIALNGNGGSYAMSKDKSSFYTMSLNAIIKHVADIFNKYLIRQWINYNWNVTKYPTLEYSRIDSRDVSALASAITQLTDAGFLAPTPADENALRDTLEMPTKPEGDNFTGIAINGAQLKAVTDLFSEVGKGLISKESAKAILQAAFPFLTQEQIDAISDVANTVPPPIPTGAGV